MLTLNGAVSGRKVPENANVARMDSGMMQKPVIAHGASGRYGNLKNLAQSRMRDNVGRSAPMRRVGGKVVSVGWAMKAFSEDSAMSNACRVISALENRDHWQAALNLEVQHFDLVTIRAIAGICCAGESRGLETVIRSVATKR
jgi:hypothetical protein